MNTSLKNREGQLLVDIENGKILRGDDRPTVSQRWLDSHPFIHRARSDEGKTQYLVGPDSELASRGITNGGDYYVYEVLVDAVAGITLQRVVEDDDE